MNHLDRIKNVLGESINLKKTVLADPVLLGRLEKVIEVLVQVFQARGKVLFCGNGGSAADAQHLAAELSGRFYLDREPLHAEALHVNTSYLTAVANDYSFSEVYARLVRAKGRNGDALVAISTSGNSSNILKSAYAAREAGMTIVGMTGTGGGDLGPLCDILLNVPSTDVPRIQEMHIVLGHIICECVERELFGKSESSENQ